jgi:CheY-like chemotaxis protein
VNTILLVEDSRFLRATNEKALARAGYNVVTACDGEEALRVAGETCPDLILLDMLLPKLSGQEVLRSLRSSPPTAAVPIVVLSSLPPSNEPRLRKDGATAYFDKASLGLERQSESLIQIVRKMLENPKCEDDNGAAALPRNGEV